MVARTAKYITLPLLGIMILFASYVTPISLAADEDEGTGLAPITGGDCATLGIGCPGDVETADASTVITFSNMVINAMLGLAALLAIVILIIAGVIFIASLGDQEKAKQAKYAILYAVIGLIVIGLAAVVVNFVTAIFAP